MTKINEPVASPDEFGSKAPDKATLKKVWRISHDEIWPLVGHVILTGLLIGFLFIALGSYFGHKTGEPIASGALSLLKELGTALVVSATAIYGYELVGHISGVLDKEHSLTSQIAVLDRSNQLLSRIVDWRSAMKGDLLKVCNHAKLVDNLIEPIEHAKNINARKQHEHHLLYLNFLCELMESSVIPVASALDQFQDNIVNRRNGRVEQFTTPDSRVVAGHMLTLLLRCLTYRDCYRSVSNVLFYEDTLMEMFERECIAACSKGVTIRRLFNVNNFEEHRPSPELFKKSQQIVAAHRALSSRIHSDYHGDGYQIRFFGEKLLEFVNTQYDHRYHDHLDRLPKSYFGLFCNQDAKTALLFVAMESERASRVGLAFRDDTDRTDEYFDAMWDAAEFAPDPFASSNSKFDHNWLDSTVDKLRLARK